MKTQTNNYVQIINLWAIDADQYQDQGDTNSALEESSFHTPVLSSTYTKQQCRHLAAVDICSMHMQEIEENTLLEKMR